MSTPTIAKERTYPNIEPKLAGQHNFAQWILSIEQTLEQLDHGEGSIWDIVIGDIKDPAAGTTTKAGKGTDDGKKALAWKRDNSFAILTMKRNCEPEVLDTIGLTRNAHGAYNELKAKYEGKTVTDLGAVLANIVRFTYDDRNTTIEEHVTEFDKRWNFMKGTLGGGFTDKVKEFGDALTLLAKSDQAKAEFLLISLPPFYNNLVENLRTKEGYTYGDISRQVRLYVPGRQKNGRKKEGTKEDLVVLKTDKIDTSKKCKYCIDVKDWKGIGHTETECRIKEGNHRDYWEWN